MADMHTSTKGAPPDPYEALQYFRNKMQFTTGPIELHSEIEEGEDLNIIDVRLEKDFDKEHIPGAINLPEDQWDKMTGLRHDKTNVIYCYSQVCHLAARAAVHFSENGFPVKELEGGFMTWKEYELPIEKSKGGHAAHGKKPSRSETHRMA